MDMERMSESSEARPVRSMKGARWVGKQQVVAPAGRVARSTRRLPVRRGSGNEGTSGGVRRTRGEGQCLLLRLGSV